MDKRESAAAVRGMDMISISLFDKGNQQYRKEAVEILAQTFPHAYKDCAVEAIEECLEEERIAIMAVENGHLVGFIGATPTYEYAWELHPLFVRKDFRSQGIGTRLIQALEKECADRGVITLYLGADDEFEQTSLGNTDLYLDTYEKMKNIKNLKRHPFEFYQKLGYKIVGVIPDANGMGKPDIFMAKRLESGLQSD